LLRYVIAGDKDVNGNGNGFAGFGAARCMFESNFPVDRQICSYRVLWNAYKRVAVQLVEEGLISNVAGAGGADIEIESDVEMLFAGTARRVYGLYK